MPARFRQELLWSSRFPAQAESYPLRTGEYQNWHLVSILAPCLDWDMRLLVADLMKKRDITAHALYRDSGDRISRSTAYRLARGEKVSLRPEEIAALCDVLEVEPNDLFERQQAEKG